MGHRHKDSRLKWTTTDAEPEISHPADALTAAEVTMLKVLVAGGGGGTTPIPNPPPTPPPDITAPVISNVTYSGITTTGATIAWTTNEAATGLVVYGTTTAYGSTTSATSSGTSHSRNLTGLTPGQLYHYQVRATDTAGNLGLSGDRTFTTTASLTLPGAPTGLTATGGNTQVTLNWTAPASNGGSAITGYRVYRNGASLIVLGVVTTYLNTGLTNGLTYTYTVAAITAVGEGPQSGSAFATPSAGGDINPPIISNVTITNITTTGADVSWSLNEGATGQVEYGLTTAYGSLSTLETAYLTAHIQTLSGLVANTTYHLRIRSADASGNLALSSDRSFSTADTAPPYVPPPAALYGPGYAADDLNNTRIGTSAAYRSSYRFRAEQSSPLNSVRLYLIANGNTGYSNGTGGTLRLDLYADDGSASHFPTGSSLANGSVTPGNPDGSSGFHTVAFSSPATLVTGTLYHVVFTNTDGNPATNYLSVDNTFAFFDDNPHQPKWPNTDWQELIKVGSGPWTIRTGSVNTPIADLTYANGSHQGAGYMETWGRGGSDGYNTCNGTIKMRETFTVSGGTRTARRGAIRLARTSGSGALTVRLETGAGSLIEEVTIAAATISTAVKGGSSSHGEGQRWYSFTFGSDHGLTNGQAYNLVLSTTGGTEYWMTCIRNGTSYGFNAVTYFSDGRAQIATDGVTWANVKALTGSPSDEGDLQFWLSA